LIRSFTKKSLTQFQLW